MRHPLRIQVVLGVIPLLFSTSTAFAEGITIQSLSARGLVVTAFDVNGDGVIAGDGDEFLFFGDLDSAHGVVAAKRGPVRASLRHAFDASLSRHGKRLRVSARIRCRSDTPIDPDRLPTTASGFIDLGFQLDGPGSFWIRGSAAALFSTAEFGLSGPSGAIAGSASGGAEKIDQSGPLDAGPHDVRLSCRSAKNGRASARFTLVVQELPGVGP